MCRGVCGGRHRNCRAPAAISVKIAGRVAGTILAIRSLLHMDLPCQCGRYTLVERIARGGTAEIFRARYEAGIGVRRYAALKMLLPSWRGHDELREMLLDEGRLLCRLPHPGIVQVLEIGEHEGAPFLALEFVEGVDGARLLTRLLGEQRPLPPEHAMTIAGRTLAALECAHRVGSDDGLPLRVVHRDISPSNILLSWHGEVKVADFGIARGAHRTRATALGLVRGKYAYMAPEQARGEEIDGRSDLFALGVVLYELMTARRLFSGATDAELQRRVAEARFELTGIERFPAALRSMLMLALCPDPRGRYQSAAEMLSDVTAAVRSLRLPSGTLELAQWLREAFPPEERPSPEEAACAAAEVTRAMTPRFELAEGSGTPEKRRGLLLLRRAAAAIFIAIAAALIPHGQAAIAPAEARAAPSASPAASASSLPPAMPGSIAVDSEPGGIRGVLIIGGDRRPIVTPYVQEGIELGEGIEGRVEFSAPGYAAQSERFRLSPETPAYARLFTLRRQEPSAISVQAEPWGLAGIDGAPARQETPLVRRALTAGTHVVRVVHPPSGRSVTARVKLAEGEHRRCLARFNGSPAISCR